MIIPRPRNFRSISTNREATWTKRVSLPDELNLVGSSSRTLGIRDKRRLKGKEREREREKKEFLVYNEMLVVCRTRHAIKSVVQIRFDRFVNIEERAHDRIDRRRDLGALPC